MEEAAEPVVVVVAVVVEVTYWVSVEVGTVLSHSAVVAVVVASPQQR